MAEKGEGRRSKAPAVPQRHAPSQAPPREQAFKTWLLGRRFTSKLPHAIAEQGAVGSVEDTETLPGTKGRETLEF